MSEQQREPAFLRQVILYDDTERHKLEEGITQADWPRSFWSVVSASEIVTLPRELRSQ